MRAADPRHLRKRKKNRMNIYIPEKPMGGVWVGGVVFVLLSLAKVSRDLR